MLLSRGILLQRRLLESGEIDDRCWSGRGYCRATPTVHLLLLLFVLSVLQTAPRLKDGGVASPCGQVYHHSTAPQFSAQYPPQPPSNPYLVPQASAPPAYSSHP